jgi:hypothetical protein
MPKSDGPLADFMSSHFGVDDDHIPAPDTPHGPAVPNDLGEKFALLNPGESEEFIVGDPVPVER